MKARGHTKGNRAAILFVLRLAAALVLAAPPALLGAGAPEYLAAEAPIPDSLKKTGSATENMGKVPDHAHTGRYRPGLLLPELRRHIPKTGLPFIDESVFVVRPRAYYRLRDNGDGTKSEAFAIGGAAGVETGWLWDSVRFGIAGFTSQKIYGPEGRDGTGLLRPDQKSYTVLGEVYVEFKAKKSSLVLGRQRLDIPYINANDSRMTPSTFETLAFRSLDFENFQVGAGHISKIRFRDESDFVSMSNQAGAVGTDKGVSVAGLRYDFSENSHVSLIEQYGWDTFNTLYADAGHFIQICDDVSLNLSAQFTDQRSVGDELVGDFETQHAGVGTSLGYRNFIASTSFTWTSDKAGIRNPWGGSPSYTSVMISDFDSAGEKAVRLGLSCDFAELGLPGVAVATSWVHGDIPGSGSTPSTNENEFDITVDYRPQVKGYDNLWFRLRYAVNDQDDGPNRTDFRFIVNYAISF